MEDEASLRLLILNVLKRLGYTLLEAQSGREGLIVWRKHRASIDLVLTDMVMPDGMTGYEFASEILKEKVDQKIIYTSGYSPDVVGADSVLKEGLEFLQKPFAPNVLANLVRKVLDIPKR